MSKMMLRSNGKPPLARSPIRLRPRHKPLQPTPDNIINTLPGETGSLTKSQKPNRSWGVEETGLRPEYHTISCELRALAKMVHQELGTKGEPTFQDDGAFGGGQRSPLFERGRFYDEYSARRNERLKRKKGEMEGYEKKTTYDLGVRVESAKKKETSKMDSRRKAAAAAVGAATPVTDRREVRSSRYSLRSTSKENKKPPMPLPVMDFEKSVGGIITERKGGRRARKAF